MAGTHAKISRLIRLIVETGCLTGVFFLVIYRSSSLWSLCTNLCLALAATIDIILFLVFPHNAYHGCVALTLAKLYSNSLLVIFNSRIHIHGGRNSPTAMSSSAPYGGKAGLKRAALIFGSSTVASSFGGGVQIQKESFTDNIPLEEQVSISYFYAICFRWLTDILPV